MCDKEFFQKNGIAGFGTSGTNLITYCYEDKTSISIKIKEKMVMYFDANGNPLYEWRKIREENEIMLYEKGKILLGTNIGYTCLIA
mgnify:CR=1 FL=1